MDPNPQTDEFDANNASPQQLKDKECVKKLKCDLKNIYKVLNVAFEDLGEAKDANLVVAIGNTGCGKSTMLTSILFGPDALHKTTVTEQRTIQTRDRKTR